ncbi:WD40-repeat-containing domain protein [Ephemerocybe angulata]|uniref:WD40-repeat-containing domain protein n=1 Tax=Ephemerocybe angulata TaxID=980116 RepID=A0A8H6MB93_9AGAR|nr:WD40-repeat-containing domain protein [Tulosesus angulatus]
MSSGQLGNGSNEEEFNPQRAQSPPPHTTFEARGIHPPTFSALKPRDYRMPGQQSFSHIAWNCDGKKLAAVGVDKITRIWNPDKSIEPRSAAQYAGGHSDDVDYISWNPTHPDLFCTSSQRDRRIVFWDARQSRYTQSCSLKQFPLQTAYHPNGRELLYTTAGNQMFFLKLDKDTPESKESWKIVPGMSTAATHAIWNNAGTGIITKYNGSSAYRALPYPALEPPFKTAAAHVAGVQALALDPRGRYLATGGGDSIVNLFDLTDWICARTIISCEHSVNSLSFSHDGEYIAIASEGSYIEICATETAAPLPSLAWHPSRYVMAYCGQNSSREGGGPPVTTISMFGLME